MSAVLPGPPEDYVDAVITDDAIGFLDSLEDGPDAAPFFLQVAWIAPHPPYFLPQPYASRYDPAALTYPEPDPPDAAKPAAHRRTAQDMGSLDAPPPDLRRALAAYYGMNSLLDDQVARPARGPGRARAPGGHRRGLHRRPRRLRRRARHVGQELHPLRRPRARPPDPGRAGRPRRRGAAREWCRPSTSCPPCSPCSACPSRTRSTASPCSRSGARRAAPPPPPGPAAGAGRRAFDVAFAEVGAFPAAMVDDPQRGNNVPFGPPASGRQVELSVMARTADWKLVHTPGRETQELYDLRADPGERAQPLRRPRPGARRRRALRRAQDWMLAHT